MLSIFAAGALTACGNTEENADNEAAAETENEAPGTEIDGGDGDNELTFSQINWAENIAVTNMWKVILEDRGYDVTLNLLEMGFTMEALESGELDANLEIWLPVQDANYLEQYEDTVHFSEETWFDSAKVGLVVPEFMEDINSIEDLNENRDLFDGEIVGFDPGAGTMEVTEELIDDYDLDFILQPSSEPAMMDEVRRAVENEEPIVVPLWSPHWAFSSFDLKFLEDPQNVYGGTEKIHHATREDFADDHPEVSQWFKNWKMNDEQIGSLINEVESTEDPLEGARNWVEDNQDLIDEWVTE
ncbi:glycine betaine ABC transporter substrate-binding protein [Alkalicoccus urumqiensis]|nr:glycine betaine ABC transporter substrate-binding protein [Alkalicoccus urumqiensis]